MNNLVLSTQYDTNVTLVSNIFIDKYMPDANGEFVKIYIYLLRAIANTTLNISISSMADIFNQTEADVIRALKYWHKNGVIQLSFDENKQPCGITLCNLACDASICATTYEETTIATAQAQVENSPTTNTTELSNKENNANNTANTDDINININNIDNTNTIDNATDTDENTSKDATEAKSYSPAQVTVLTNQDMDFKMLLKGISNYLGASLSPTEISSIAFIYDTLGFPSDLIEYLIEQCSKRGHKSMRYIQKVAMEWSRLGIITVQQAKLENSSKDEVTYSIMNAFGLGRHPGQEEREYIEKWIKTYGFNKDVIIEACNRTLRKIHQPSFQYADSILKKWKANNIYTYSDIMKADVKFELSKNSNRKKNNVVKNVANRFNNFSQRDTNIDNLESSLLNTDL